MHRTAALLLLALFSPGAQSATVWKGTSTHSITSGSGDVLDTGGAAVTLSAGSMGESAFIGAITSLEAGSFQGKEVRLDGSLRVNDGAGAAAIWLRADGPEGKLAFASSGRQPVRAGDGATARELQLYIPAATTSIKFGVTLTSAGHLDVEHLTLTAQPAKSSAVSAHDMVAHALPLIRANALNAHNVSWSAEEAALLTPDLKDLPAPEAYARIRKVLDALADRHSYLQTPKAATAYRQDAIPSRPIEVRAMQDIGYVLVPGLRGTDARAAAAFTTELCEHIGTLAPTSSKGWILDLRQDIGGNMWPMLNGLQSLLGTRDAGAFRDRHGVTTHWRSRATPACEVDLSESPVAVLVGPKTASSGEAVAVAFRARPATRFFGNTTAGLATSNRAFPLPDGGVLRLTTAAMLDRDGEAYPEGITPESIVSSDQDAIESAAAWLRSMP